MRRFAHTGWYGALLLAALAGALRSQTLELRNAYGNIEVTVVADDRLHIEGVGRDRPATADDTITEQRPGRIVVRCEPADGAAIDIKAKLPFGFSLVAHTIKGNLTINGMVRGAELRTGSGDISLTAPWEGTRIRLDAAVEPANLTLPHGVRFLTSSFDAGGGRRIWRLSDNLEGYAVHWGNYRIYAETLKNLTLRDYHVPEHWPAKFHWQAPRVVEKIIRGERSAARPRGASAEMDDEDSETGEVLFRSDVRMVNMLLTAKDEQGRPVTDLEPEQFKVIEDGKPQKVNIDASDETPFNLAILLDLSGSTRPDRSRMMAAAESFIGLSHDHDRVAVYALAGGMFHVVSPLSRDREMVLQRLRAMPDVGGGSPLYDTIALAYFEELHQLPGERNALIVISDGIDNQIGQKDSPSAVNFGRLVKAAKQMDAILYPVFLLSGERFGRGWSQKAKRKLDELCEATGGKVFPAASISDLEPVFPKVAEELRSVYSLAYYPTNQTFNGKWRKVEIKIDRTDLDVRARPGYFAR